MLSLFRHLDSRFRRVGTGSLQVLSVEESDAGDYQCRAENREDSVDASATLEVQGKISKPLSGYKKIIYYPLGHKHSTLSLVSSSPKVYKAATKQSCC